MKRALVSCLCLAALVAATGCQSMGGHWDWQNIDVDRYTPHVTMISKAATINLLKNADVEQIELVGTAAEVVSTALANDIQLDPNLAVEQVRGLIEKNAPAVAADQGIMSVIDAAVVIAVGQVEDLVNKHGPKFDQSDLTVKLIRAALLGVKEGTDALLLPGGPPPIPGPNG